VTIGRLLSVVVMALAGGLSASFAGAQAAYYPVYCQGIAVGPGGSRMFLSSGIYYAPASPPEGNVLADAALTDAFAAAVKAQTGEAVLGQTCYTRPSRDELEALIASTRSVNGSNWQMVDVAWAPAGSYPLDANPAALAAGTGASGGAGARSAAAPAPSDADNAAERLAAERRQREAAERAAAAAQAEAERQRAITKAAEDVRALNARQAEMAANQVRENAEAKRIFDEKQRVYEERQRAFTAAEARYQAEVRAAAEARRRWEADVLACQSGDISRCAPGTPPGTPQ
jgi:hypothetical protein